MNEDFVSFEIAKKLKEKGMSMPNRLSFAIYKDNGELSEMRFIGGGVDNYELAPSISQALKWLREEKKLHLVCPYYERRGFYFYIQEFGFGGRYNSIDNSDDYYETYEETALAGIEYVLDNLI